MQCRRDLGSIPGLARSLREGHGNPLQYSCLENPHGQKSLVGYSPRGCKESDTTKLLIAMTSLVAGLPSGSVGQESACSAGDPGSIPGSGRSSSERNGDPFQYSCLENPMDREVWWATVHGVSLVAQMVKNPPAMQETWV